MKEIPLTIVGGLRNLTASSFFARLIHKIMIYVVFFQLFLTMRIIKNVLIYLMIVYF